METTEPRFSSLNRVRTATDFSEESNRDSERSDFLLILCSNRCGVARSMLKSKREESCFQGTAGERWIHPQHIDTAPAKTADPIWLVGHGHARGTDRRRLGAGAGADGALR